MGKKKKKKLWLLDVFILTSQLCLMPLDGQNRGGCSRKYPQKDLRALVTDMENTLRRIGTRAAFGMQTIPQCVVFCI